MCYRRDERTRRSLKIKVDDDASQICRKKLSHPSNPKKYVTSWNIELFIGCKSSVAAQKKEQEFYAAAQKTLSRGDGTEGRALCSSRTPFLGITEKTYWGIHLYFLTVFFALTESIGLPSIVFHLPWLSLKSVIGSMERITETLAMKGCFGVL